MLKNHFFVDSDRLSWYILTYEWEEGERHQIFYLGVHLGVTKGDLADRDYEILLRSQDELIWKHHTECEVVFKSASNRLGHKVRVLVEFRVQGVVELLRAGVEFAAKLTLRICCFIHRDKFCTRIHNKTCELSLFQAFEKVNAKTVFKIHSAKWSIRGI